VRYQGETLLQEEDITQVVFGSPLLRGAVTRIITHGAKYEGAQCDADRVLSALRSISPGLAMVREKATHLVKTEIFERLEAKEKILQTALSRFEASQKNEHGRGIPGEPVKNACILSASIQLAVGD
jgi:hypothetical protein